MGQTRVDLLHLLEDLRDAYPESLEETILTEIVANALDSGATRIALTTDAAGATVTVGDDGRGMTRRELARFHDLATTSKRRGRGIGFAGVGIKLALLASEEVTTESRRGKTHVATVWHLASKHRAPWKWLPPPGLVGERGTAVRLRLSNPLSELLDPAYLEAALQRHFAPLFDPYFRPVLAPFYPQPIHFWINGRAVEPGVAAADEAGGRTPVDRSAAAGRVTDPEQSGFPSHRAARRVLSRLPKGDSGGCECPARAVG